MARYYGTAKDDATLAIRSMHWAFFSHVHFIRAICHISAKNIDSLYLINFDKYTLKLLAVDELNVVYY